MKKLMLILMVLIGSFTYSQNQIIYNSYRTQYSTHSGSGWILHQDNQVTSQITLGSNYIYLWDGVNRNSVTNMQYINTINNNGVLVEERRGYYNGKTPVTVYLSNSYPYGRYIQILFLHGNPYEMLGYIENY